MKPKQNKNIKISLEVWIESLAQHFQTPIIVRLRADKQGIRFESLEAVNPNNAYDGWGDDDPEDEPPDNFEPLQAKGHKLKSPINEVAR